jgi:hypothetical protein
VHPFTSRGFGIPLINNLNWHSKERSTLRVNHPTRLQFLDDLPLGKRNARYQLDATRSLQDTLISQYQPFYHANWRSTPLLG